MLRPRLKGRSVPVDGPHSPPSRSKIGFLSGLDLGSKHRHLCLCDPFYEQTTSTSLSRFSKQIDDLASLCTPSSHENNHNSGVLSATTTFFPPSTVCNVPFPQSRLRSRASSIRTSFPADRSKVSYSFTAARVWSGLCPILGASHSPISLPFTPSTVSTRHSSRLAAKLPRLHGLFFQLARETLSVH